MTLFPCALAMAGKNAFFTKNRVKLFFYLGLNSYKSSSGFFKREHYTVTFNKPGYGTNTLLIKSTVDGWYFGNLLFGGVLGMLIVDPATGAMYNLPDSAIADLEPSQAKEQKSRSLEIKSLEDLTENEISQLESLN